MTLTLAESRKSTARLFVHGAARKLLEALPRVEDPTTPTPAPYLTLNPTLNIPMLQSADGLALP